VLCKTFPNFESRFVFNLEILPGPECQVSTTQPSCTQSLPAPNYVVDDDQMQNVFICVTYLLCCRLYRAAVIGLYVDCHFITFTLFILSNSFHDAVFLL
jgi:hypothetical protein